MTFKVRVKCLICRTLTDPTINSVKETNVEALNLLHYKLCAAMKLEFSPKREWDFADDPFPYCESCSQRVHRIGELMDQLKRIEDEINGALATVSALVIISDKREINTNDPPLVTPNLGQMKEYFKSQRSQEKHDYFRSLVIQRLDPRVNVERCDSSGVNNPDLSEEQYDYELVPNTTLLKTEPRSIEAFPDTVVKEEIILDETEYKVEASSDVISGAVDEPIRRNEITTSLSPVPTVTFLILAPVQGDRPITTLPNGKGKLNEDNEAPVLSNSTVLRSQKNKWSRGSSTSKANKAARERRMEQTFKEKKKAYDRLRRLKLKKQPTANPKMQHTLKQRRKEYDRLRNLKKKQLAENSKIIVDTELERWLAVLEQKGIRRELPDVRPAPPVINNANEIKTYSRKKMESWIKSHTKWTLKKEAPETWRKPPEHAFFYAGNHYMVCPYCDIHPQIAKPGQKVRQTSWSDHVQQHTPLPCYATNCSQTFLYECRRRKHMRQTHFKPITRPYPDILQDK